MCKEFRLMLQIHHPGPETEMIGKLCGKTLAICGEFESIKFLQLLKALDDLTSIAA